MRSKVIEAVCNISVVICTYTEKRWDDLVGAVESVKRQTYTPQEIIVVVDYNPALLEMARERLEDVVVVENIDVKGLSGARNSGIAVAISSLIAFLDDDAIASPEWLKLLSEGFIHEHILGIGGPIIPTWSTIKPDWLPEEFYWVIGCTYRGMPLTHSKIRNPIGANMCFRRAIFESVGGFRSEIGRLGTLPMGCEETELCIRVRQQWPQSYFLYLPSVSVSHRVPANRTTWSYFCSRCYSEGLSKAVVTLHVGQRDGLASEYSYSLHTLPKGVARNLRDVFYQGDMMGLIRASVIVTGLMITTAGYCIGSIVSMVTKSKGKISTETHPEYKPTIARKPQLNSEIRR